MLLEIKDVHKVYTGTSNASEQALKGVNLQLEENKLVVIYGPSGWGKTSLLNIISGLDSDYQGEVLFKNQRLGELSPDELTLFRKENIGFVFQNF
ncbi:ATP-binding cassette domain-containing protein, partial [Streptococcus danieliae]|nr:ATP-binding cassette domain-containing protein [Streptococcus danieliae]